MNHAQNLAVAADHGVELALARHGGQVARVFFQHLVAGLSFWIGDPLTAAHLLDGLVDAVFRHPRAVEDAPGGGVTFAEDCQEDMFGGDVFVFQPVGFLVSHVNDPLDARGDEDLPRAPTEDVGLGAAAQHIIKLFAQLADIHVEHFEQLGDRAVGLLDQRQQDVLGVNLVVSVALDDLRGALGSFLSALGKAVESHHGCTFLLSRGFAPGWGVFYKVMREDAPDGVRPGLIISLGR